MDNRSYYFAEERLVFLTLEDARKFFFEEILFNDTVNECDFNIFLGDKFNYYALFIMTDEEKSDVLSDYHEYLFDCWVEEELVACDMYE